MSTPASARVLSERLMIEISSPDNPRYRRLMRLLASGRERRKSGLAVLDGVHLVAAYRTHCGPAPELVVTRAALKDQEIRREADAAAATLVLADALFAALSTVVTPTGVLAVVPMPERRVPGAEVGPCVVLEDVQDPGNLGSILRSAAAAGVPDVLLTAGCAQVWSPRVLRAGMGAHFALRLYENCALPAFFEVYRGRPVATVREGARRLFAADLRGEVALLFGNEGAGLSDALLARAAERVTIPMPGSAESLNVAAAAAVCLFERVRQQGG